MEMKMPEMSAEQAKIAADIEEEIDATKKKGQVEATPGSEPLDPESFKDTDSDQQEAA